MKDIFGTLPDWVIKDFIKRKVIKIKNLSKNWEKDLDQVSIDFHLGHRVLMPSMGRHIVIDIRKGVTEQMYEKINLKEGESFVIRPGQFFIGETLEDFTLPADIIGRLEGKSSLARLGIVIHQTSARFDPGWSGTAALELRNNSDNDVILYCGDKICAFAFERLMSPVAKPWQKKGYRNHGNKTLHSRINEDNLSRVSGKKDK
ncbi:MAG TPA: dCTP deaminase [Patescibacteria group bacterium]|nr:dCTP deaminase [Patescibacteria group bacterium]